MQALRLSASRVTAVHRDEERQAAAGPAGGAVSRLRLPIDHRQYTPGLGQPTRQESYGPWHGFAAWARRKGQGILAVRAQGAAAGHGKSGTRELPLVRECARVCAARRRLRRRPRPPAIPNRVSQAEPNRQRRSRREERGSSGTPAAVRGLAGSPASLSGTGRTHAEIGAGLTVGCAGCCQASADGCEGALPRDSRVRRRRRFRPAVPLTAADRGLRTREGVKPRHPLIFSQFVTVETT